MAGIIIDGKAVAADIRANVAKRVAELKAKGVEPALSVILVGDNPASVSYVTGKQKALAEVGMIDKSIHLPESTTEQELLDLIAKLNADKSVHGILVQLPLPKHINEEKVTLAIDPKKDVDGFHPVNMGNLLIGKKGFLPCTPHGILVLLERAGVQTNGARAAVIGRSNIVGKPMALLLMQANCTVTVCHSHTKNLAEVVRRADVVVAAIGRPRFITADMIKPGAAVIDVGINRLADGTLCGDVDFEAAQDVAGCITPVPGGVGPMTIAMLMKNTLSAAKRYAN